MTELHDRLVELQSTEELERKMFKAVSHQDIWTQEEIDFANRNAQELHMLFVSHVDVLSRIYP